MVSNINLENEINNVLSKSIIEEFPEIKAMIHTDEIDEEINYITMLDIERDFSQNLTDIVIISFLIPLGDYIDKIYKYKDKLEISLCFKRNLKQHCKRYRALILNIDKNISNSKIQSLNKDDLNKINLIEIKAQLIPMELLLIKKITHEGIYSNIRRDDIIKQSILYELSKIKIYGKYLNLNYNIYPSDYNDKIDNVIIPTGTKIGKIPYFIQKEYGVYNNGINIYFRLDKNENLYFWVYPLTDFNRVNKSKNIGIIYNTVRTGLSASELSYFNDNGQIKLVTDNAQISGDDYNNLFNKGKGIEYMSVTDNIKSYKYDLNNKLDKYDLNKEIYSIRNNDETDFTKNIGLTDNIALINSELNKDKVGYVQVVIYNFSGLWGGDPIDELIYPGMPFYYIYNKKDNGINKLIKLPGSIVKQHITFQILNKTMSSVLLLNVKKPLLIKE